MQLAQCRFPGLVITNAKILIYFFSNTIHGSNFINQHSETVMVWIYHSADCSLRKKGIVSFIIIFGTLSFPIRNTKRFYISAGMRWVGVWFAVARMWRRPRSHVVFVRRWSLFVPLVFVNDALRDCTREHAHKKVKVAHTRLLSVGFRS